LVDVVVDTDDQALEAARRFLSYLPSHHREPPPLAPVPEGSDEVARTVVDIVPEQRSKVYDMRRVIAALADIGSMLELKPRFGKSAVTALARLGGRSVGFVGNNPMFKGGSIDVDACRKITSFLVLCDSFHIPIVFLVDQPGFLIGQEGENRWAPGRIMNWLNALSQVTVPKVSLVLRKSYGQAYLNMGGGRNSDVVACWPTADLGFMDPAVGVNVLYGIRREEEPERFAELVEELRRDTSAWSLAALYEAHAVVDPRETRDFLRRSLEVHALRPTGGLGERHLANWPTSF
jgi:acetyl-CoA carboxylase carboxyltransferase component